MFFANASRIDVVRKPEVYVPRTLVQVRVPLLEALGLLLSELACSYEEGGRGGHG